MHPRVTVDETQRRHNLHRSFKEQAVTSLIINPLPPMRLEMAYSEKYGKNYLRTATWSFAESQTD